MQRGAIDFTKTGVAGPISYDTFGCNVFQEAPFTPDAVTPHVSLQRVVHTNAQVTAPDGQLVTFWGFEDPLSTIPADRRRPYPSPVIRVRQGQIVHTTLVTRSGPHTIHHHGIEPTTFNDGVGHVSFEVGEQYTYQWRPAHAGTFFYHCHRNTPLHFEMGMFGPLIVDPPEGPGRAWSGGPAYQVERTWLVDDVDPRWHTIPNVSGHEAGLCGEDVGLNIFRPKYFLISGVFNNRTPIDPRVVATAQLGQTILIRLLNASYSVLRATFALDATLISCDGHALGRSAWNRPVVIPKGTPFELGTAGRHDLLITPTQRGNFTVRLEFLDWITRRVQDNGRGVAQTRVVVI